MEMTSETLENVAAACGFRNYSHFYRLFVRKNRLSPKNGVKGSVWGILWHVDAPSQNGLQTSTTEIMPSTNPIH